MLINYFWAYLLPFFLLAIFLGVNYLVLYVGLRLFIQGKRLWFKSLLLTILSSAVVFVGLMGMSFWVPLHLSWLLEVVVFLLVFYLSVVLIFYYGVNCVGVIRNKFPGRPLLSLWLAGMNIVVSFIVLVLILTVAIWIDENPCEYKSGKYFHYFNDHVKSLCLREDKRECPQNLEELRAFDPKRMAELEKCAQVKYEFDQETNLPIWQVNYRGLILNFDADNEGGFRLNGTP